LNCSIKIIMKKNKITYFWAIISLLAYFLINPERLSAQDESSVNFYRHYNGTIGKNMIVVADMLCVRNQVSGYYFYFLRYDGEKFG